MLYKTTFTCKHVMKQNRDACYSACLHDRVIEFVKEETFSSIYCMSSL